jgi:hypothetical protein
MNREAIAKVSRKVSRQFPEMKSVRPSVRTQSNSRNGSKRYTLTFKGKAALPGGRKISRVVRVVADDHGKVFKMSTSK